MRVSRIHVESSTAGSQSYAFDSQLGLVSGSPTENERFLAVFRNLFLGIKRQSTIFVKVEDIEIELSADMVPLIGERLAGEFEIIDLALSPAIRTDPTDIRDVQAVVARAALETVGVLAPTLDLERIDQAILAVDRYRDPLANDAHAAYLRRTGLLQLFSRRSGRDLLDPDDPVVRQLDQFDDVLANRRRQVASSSSALPQEASAATTVIRDLVSTRLGGIPPEMAAEMNNQAAERDISQWVAQQHDRQITPVLDAACERHAAGIPPLGSMPLVLDMRRVEGLPPGGDALLRAVDRFGDDLQVIAVGASDDVGAWLRDLFRPTARC